MKIGVKKLAKPANVVKRPSAAAREPRIGGYIQRLRRQKSLSQAQLAQAIGVSPSYLNLIEHNRRRITVSLLLKISHFFGVDAGELAESDKSRLAGDLMEIFGDELFSEFELTNHDVHDLAVSNAKVGQAIIRLFDEYVSLRKGRTQEAVVPAGSKEIATDAVSDFLQTHANYFGELEACAERVRRDMELASESFENGLRTYLYNVFGVRWYQSALPENQIYRLDADAAALITADILPAESAIFIAARQLGQMVASSEIESLLIQSALPPDAVGIGRGALASYFAAALIMPYEPFHLSCKETRYDIERMGRLFKASFEQICHRMTTLQRPGLTGIPLHFVRTDIAGNISKRFSLSGIHIPRHFGACPRWNVYSAFLQPNQFNVQVSQMPEGQRYLCIAKSTTKFGHRHNSPRRHLSICLGCHIADAPSFVYSDGIDISDPSKSVPIGVGCHICPRHDCAQRAYPQLRAM